MSTIKWIISGSGAQGIICSHHHIVKIPAWMQPDVAMVYQADGSLLNYTVDTIDGYVTINCSHNADATVMFTSSVITAVFSYIMLVNENYDYQRLNIEYYIASPQPHVFSHVTITMGMQQPGDLCDSVSGYTHTELASSVRCHMAINNVCCERFFHCKKYHGQRCVTMCYELTPSQSLAGGKFTVITHRGAIEQGITSPTGVVIHDPKVLSTSQVQSWSSANKITVTVGSSSKVSTEFKKPVKKITDYQQLAAALSVEHSDNRDALSQQKTLELSPNVVTTVYDIKVRNTTSGYVKLYVDIEDISDMIYYICDRDKVTLTNYCDGTYTFVLDEVPSAVVPQGHSTASVMTSGRTDFNASTDYLIEITHMLSARK